MTEIRSEDPRRRQPQPRLDPVIFSMATRYAIRRYATPASETCAGQVIAHAETIKKDAGARGAILDEIDQFLRTEEKVSMVSQGEYDAIRKLWGETVREALS